jgi:hypothetical protein
MPPPQHTILPEGFQKCSFVDSLVGLQSQVASLNFRYWRLTHRNYMAKPNDTYLEFQDLAIASIHSRDHSSIPHFLLHPSTRSLLPSTHQICCCRFRDQEP